MAGDFAAAVSSAKRLLEGLQDYIADKFWWQKDCASGLKHAEWLTQEWLRQEHLGARQLTEQVQSLRWMRSCIADAIDAARNAARRRIQRLFVRKLERKIEREDWDRERSHSAIRTRAVISRWQAGSLCVGGELPRDLPFDVPGLPADDDPFSDWPFEGLFDWRGRMGDGRHHSRIDTVRKTHERSADIGDYDGR